MQEQKEKSKREYEEKKALKARAVEEAAKREYRDLFAQEDLKVTNADMREVEKNEEQKWPLELIVLPATDDGRAVRRR